MLIMFRASNFMSFRDEVVLDMRATGYKQHPDHVMDVGQHRLLKTLAIYGANASGKSNLISAMYCFERFIQRHLFEKEQVDSEVSEDTQRILNPKMEPFLLTSAPKSAIEMEMAFYHQDHMYQYGFSVNGDVIEAEWLLYDNQEVFDIQGDNEISFGSHYKPKLREYTRKSTDRLYLSVLDYFAGGDIKLIVDGFKAYFEKQFTVYFELLFETSVKGFFLAEGFSRIMTKNEELRQQVAGYINKIDVGIKDFAVEPYTITNRRTGETREKPVIKTVHDMYDMDGKFSGTTTFDLRQESAGTLRFLSLIEPMIRLLESGGVFVVDELTVRLHPLLARFLIDLFQSKQNSKGAQLIFTTHETSFMNKEQFRRDEVAFVDKDNKGISRLYVLSDLDTRSDATFSKDYFSGKYGAIPIIRDRDAQMGDGYGQTESE